MEGYPRIQLSKETIDLLRKSLTTDEPLTESLSWSEIDSFEITGIDNIDSEFRANRPLAITINAAELRVESVEPESDSLERRLKQETNITYRNGMIEFDDDKTNNENFVEFVKFMFKEGMLTVEDLPESMPSATKNFIINDSKETLDGDDTMDHANRIDIGDEEIYYNPKDPIGQKKEHMKYLIGKYADDDTQARLTEV